MNKKLRRFFNHVETALGKEKVAIGPVHAQIEPTNRCNQDCGMCSRLEMLKSVSEGDMTLEQFQRILDQLPYLNSIQINGLGEPLMNPHTPEFIRMARAKDINVSMNTNAAFITEKKAQELLDSGINIIKISMDSAEAKLYEDIRGAKLFPVLKGLEQITKARRERQQTFPTINFNSVIQKANKHELLPIVRIADQYKIDNVRFKVVGMFDLFDPNDLGIAQEEVPEICQKLKTDIQKENLNVKTNLDDLIAHPERLFRQHKVHPCYSPYNEVYIQCYGGVRLCCEFYDPHSDVGNMFQEDFKDIWNGKRMKEIRRRYWQGDTFFKNCEGCNRFYPNEVKYKKIENARKPIEFLVSNKLSPVG